ncbi:MAG TPA: hypothetical protein VKW08_14580 [Xanthobacteraceae bacterium]|jgi:hypothetical protein|nr:hypothetical protein [Xanthobacteraceae bacterium]
MLYRGAIGAIVLACLLAPPGAFAFDQSKYPDLKGQWLRVGSPNWDDEHAPLTPEYQAIFQANLKDKAAGGAGNDPTYFCISPGMPRIMNAYDPMEVVVTPSTTYILIQHIHDQRRIYTDGRSFPTNEDPTYAGYSVGKWIDTKGSGHYDALEVETRNLKGPRLYDESGLPFHEDNETVINERIYLDAADANLLHDDITVMDHALTRPFSAAKRYARVNNPQPVWREQQCSDFNHHVLIGKENYDVNADGFLVPVKKDQPPPDLKYFKRP